MCIEGSGMTKRASDGSRITISGGGTNEVEDLQQ